MPGYAEDLSGRTFGRLTVIFRAANIYGPRPTCWLCRCECGKEKVIAGSSLRRGLTTSCGCYRAARMARLAKHGHNRPGRRTRAYAAWAAMRQRCCDPNDKEFANYGGRGIAICARWQGPDGFANFLADMGEPPSSCHSLDRFPDQDGGYGPGNCRWATAKEQARNMRANRLINIDGETRCVAEWCEVRGLPRTTLYTRLRRGWDEREAVLTPKLR